MENLPECRALYIDHIVGNQPDLTMEDAAKWLVTLHFSISINIREINYKYDLYINNMSSNFPNYLGMKKIYFSIDFGQ